MRYSDLVHDELMLLQAIRMKGRAGAVDVAAATEIDEGTLAHRLREMAEVGLVEEIRTGFRLTPVGAERLRQQLATERDGVDRVELEVVYHQFVERNAILKRLALGWQQRDGVPNDHADQAYDHSTIRGLHALHASCEPILARLAEVVPRLVAYPRRLRASLDRIDAGDTTYFLRPLIDSYHTVWMELHEELIGLTGRTRREEAQAGRAE